MSPVSLKKWSNIKQKWDLLGLPGKELLFHSTEASDSCLSAVNTYFLSVKFCCLSIPLLYWVVFFPLLLPNSHYSGIEVESNSRTAVSVLSDRFNGTVVSSYSLNFLPAFHCLLLTCCTNSSLLAVSVHIALHVQRFFIKGKQEISSSQWIISDYW